ncbi:MAG TPA: aminoglycoside phosphotransferase family protein [Holophagaceae bacterium]|nr:aminoglycoside phosphotransferase family protein [Holophagaceae bacterium]
MIQAALAAAAAFDTPGRPLEAAPLGEGAGHIHRSFRIACEHGAVVVQRLNERVFPDLDAVMGNMVRVTAHLGARLPRALTLVPVLGGGYLHRDVAGAWRCTRFIEGGRMPLEPATPADARAAARALGSFLKAMSDFPVEDLRIPISGFHDTAARLASFRAIVKADTNGRVDDARPLIEVALAHATLAYALAERGLPLRPVHNDTKLANVLLDEASGGGLCVLDLDTVMPGLSAHDFGDLVRSAAFDGKEDDAGARLDLERLRVISEGYQEGAAESLSDSERAAFGLGARVIAYELGLRFLTDHLEGDVYFGAAWPGQNLARARAQFARLRTLEAQSKAVEGILNPR